MSLKRVAIIFVICFVASLAIGVVVGTIGLATAKADQCSGWNGRFINTMQCDSGYNCTGISFGPFWTNQCNYPPSPPQEYP